MNRTAYPGYVIAVAHCILNQTTRWFWKGSGGWVEGFIAELLEGLKPLCVGLYQLPCPEFGFLGNPRKPMTRGEYEKLPGFASYCKALAERALKDLESFRRMSKEPGIEVVAVIGVEGSPSCGVEMTSQLIAGERVRVTGMGLFMETLERLMRSKGFETAFYGLDLKRREETASRIAEEIVKWVKGLAPL